MAKYLMAEFKKQAGRAFSFGMAEFTMFGRKFDIKHMHDDEFGIMAGNDEIVRIKGTAKKYIVVEV